MSRQPSARDLRTHHEDFRIMQQALALAEQGLGRVAPNPSVGCLVVKNGKIIGKGRSADGGRPHAETQALAMAGAGAKGATIYTTLEPCGHFGKTPPCVDALIKAGADRVVIACRDPNQESHNCLDRLEKAGIAVTLDVCAEEALALNEGFFKVLAHNRPLVTAKIATTLDGRIATHTGHSQWITGEAARKKVHEFRATHDAVLAGVGTVLADDPQLNVRLPAHDFQPVRIVIDPALKTPPDSRLVKGAENENVWLICGGQADNSRQKALVKQGAKLVTLEQGAGGIFEPQAVLRALADQGITRLFIEGGAATLTPFLKAGLVDRLLWFRAPKVIGGDGLPVFQALGVDTVDEALCFSLEEQSTLGEDFLEIWRLKR